MREERIDTTQAVMLMAAAVLPTAILTVPNFVIKLAGQDAWLSVAAATAAGLLVALLAANLCQLFPQKNLFSHSEELLGKVLGKIVCLLYIWWFLQANSLIINEFSSFLCIALLPNTPSTLFFVAVVAVAGYAVYGGLEVLARYTQLYLPLLLGLLFLVFLLTAKDIKISRILPVFEAEPLQVLKGAAVPLSWFGEIILLAVIAPSLEDKRKVRRVAVLATLFNGASVAACVLVAVLVFGSEVAGNYIFPTYNAVRTVSIANFLERLESIVVAVWMLGGFAKVGVFYYAAALGSAQLLGLRDYRPLVVPLGTVLTALALTCENAAELIHFIATVWPPYAFTVFEAGIPLLLYTVAKSKKSGGSSTG